MNSDGDPGTLKPSEAAVMKGFKLDRAGRMRFPGGESLVMATVQAVLVDRYRTLTGTDYILWVEPGTLPSYNVKVRNNNTLTVTTIGTAQLSTGRGWRHFSEQVDNKIFITSTLGIQVWDGNTATGLRDAGLKKPYDAAGSFTPVASDGGAGNLDSSPGQDYSWVVTYYSSTLRIESNPSVESNALSLVEKKASLGTISSGSVNLLMATGVTHVYKYRRGGILGQYRYVGSQPLVASTALVLTDDTPDRDASLDVASYANLQPPIGITVIKEFNNRLFGAGERILNPYDVTEVIAGGNRAYFSRPGEYEQWGYLDNGVDDDGGYINIHRDPADGVRSFETSGSVLFAGCKESVWAVTGRGFRTFASDQRSNIGVASARSMKRAVNPVYYLGIDKKLYIAGNESDYPKSLRINNRLEAVSDSVVEAAIVEFFDNQLFVMIPVSGQPPVSFAYDILRDNWVEVTDSRYSAACTSVGIDPATGKQQMLVGKSTGGIYSPYTEGVSGTVPVKWKSDRIDYGQDAERGRPVSLLIEGDTTDALAVTVTSHRKGSSDSTSDYVLNATQEALLKVNRLPANLHGESFDVTVEGNLTNGAITRVTVGVLDQRESVK